MDCGWKTQTSAGASAFAWRSGFLGNDLLSVAKLAAVANDDTVPVRETGDDLDRRLTLNAQSNVPLLNSVLGRNGKNRGVVPILGYGFQRHLQRAEVGIERQCCLGVHTRHQLAVAVVKIDFRFHGSCL